MASQHSSINSGPAGNQRLNLQLNEIIQQHLEKESEGNHAKGTIKFPKWIDQRPHMSWDFHCLPRMDDIKVGPIRVFPSNTQEYLLMRDILSCMVGIDGDYIKALPRKDLTCSREFKYDETASPSLLQMTKLIMPICSYYSTVVAFMEERMHFKYGKVNHAVAAAMRNIFNDYYLFVSRVEHELLLGKLTLQKLHLDTQKLKVKIGALASAAVVIHENNSIGGSVLSALHQRATSMIGDKIVQEVYIHLVESASVPYFEILKKWIYEGTIWDPYSEFLVEDNKIYRIIEDVPAENSILYWEKRYTIRQDKIPLFLKEHAEKILKTGKYLNVVRECGHSIKYPDSTPLTYSIGKQPYYERINDAYEFASEKLLDLLINENDLKGRLGSVKHYFLLDTADFILQFMDMAEEELHKDIDSIMPTRLEALLELAIRTSSMNCDKYKDSVKTTLMMEHLGEQMSAIINILNIVPTQPNVPEKQLQNVEMKESILGIEAFTFDYEINWPLCIIINHRAILCYQILFRHLFYCKYVESRLSRIWALNKIAKVYSRSTNATYYPAYALCQRMMNFIQNLNYYFMMEVVEPHWQTFMDRINQALNLDEVLEVHENFLNTCILECMLVVPSLLESLRKLMALCISFSNFMQECHNAKTLSSANQSNLLLECKAHVFGPSGNSLTNIVQSTFKQKVSQFQAEFDKVFFSFLTSLSNIDMGSLQTSNMPNLLYRMDFNGFYTENK